jgi:hypothetical protein
MKKLAVFIGLLAFIIAEGAIPRLSIYQLVGTNLIRVHEFDVVTNTIVLVAEFEPTPPTNITITLRP